MLRNKDGNVKIHYQIVNLKRRTLYKTSILSENVYVGAESTNFLLQLHVDP